MSMLAVAPQSQAKPIKDLMFLDWDLVKFFDYSNNGEVNCFLDLNSY